VVLPVALVYYLGTFFCQAALRVPRAPIHAVPPELSAPETVALRARDGAHLEGWLFHPRVPASGNCAVVLHGIADSRSGAAGFARLFLNRGDVVLTPDIRAHGRSGGAMLTYGLLEKYDLVDWAAQLRARQGCRKMYALGESLGAALVLQAAAAAPVFDAVVAEGSYAGFADVALYRVRRYAVVPHFLSSATANLMVWSGIALVRLRYGLDLTQASPILGIAATSCPVLLIHGDRDGETPSSHSIALARANPKVVLWIVHGAGHTGAWGANPALFESRVTAWLDR
jgi:pimeloyl-ACP methyl ester carboxylesterase